MNNLLEIQTLLYRIYSIQQCLVLSSLISVKFILG
jgi:hypothetical protein